MNARWCLAMAMLAVGVGRSAVAVAELPNTPVDVAQLTSHPEEFHDQEVHVRGVVTSVCKDEGWFIDIVPLSGKGEGVLVSARNGAFKFPKDSVGKVAAVQGTFYSKVYPLYRMQHWHHHGWRAKEKTIPRFARVFRIQADCVDFGEPDKKASIEQTTLSAYTSPVVDLDQMEFEAARMGTGKKCLHSGEETPEHSTGRYHELLFAIEGELVVKMESVAGEVTISRAQACYIPPQTKHSVINRANRRACYIFVCSLPEQKEAHGHPPEKKEEHGH